MQFLQNLLSEASFFSPGAVSNTPSLENRDAVGEPEEYCHKNTKQKGKKIQVAAVPVPMSANVVAICFHLPRTTQLSSVNQHTAARKT